MKAERERGEKCKERKETRGGRLMGTEVHRARNVVFLNPNGGLTNCIAHCVFNIIFNQSCYSDTA